MPMPFDLRLIEEGARADQIHGRTSDALALSQAISLKRIADALHTSTSQYHAPMPLADVLNKVAYK